MPARYRTAAWWSRGAAAAAELPAALRFPKRDVPQSPSELACLRPRQRLIPRKPPSPAGRRKCEGATGSLATLAPDRSPSHPPQHPHGSRLPTISRGELQVGVRHYTRSGLCQPHQKRKTPAVAERGSLAGDSYAASSPLDVGLINGTSMMSPLVMAAPPLRCG